MSHPFGGNGEGSRPRSGGRWVPSNLQRNGKHEYWQYRPLGRRSAPYWLLASQQRKNAHKPRSYWLLYLVLVFLIVGLLTSIIAITTPVAVGVAGYNYYDQQLSLANDYSSVGFENTYIFDRNHVLLYERQSNQGARDYVFYKNIPQVLIDATTSAEDPTFFTNSGYDLYAILRAFYINVSGAGSSGASTITQQVARLTYLPPELRNQPTADRKLREIILAIKLAQSKPKEQIMELYLNQIFYGNFSYGIEAAAQGFFGKKASELNTAEAAMLAGLPQAPSAYNPRIDFKLAKARQKIVLGLMLKYNKITVYEEQKWDNFDIEADLANGQRTDNLQIRCPHFVNYVLDQLSGQTDSTQLQAASLNFTPDEWNRGGYEITTTIDVKLEEQAEKIAQQRIDSLKGQNASNAALIAIKPQTGEILAMMGSIDFNNKQIDGQVNVATSDRQAGSAIKPITYAEALTKGWTPATILADVSTKFESNTPGQAYVPHDFDNNERGPVSLRNALGSSLNIPAVQALQFDRVQNMMDLATQMGIHFKHSADFYGLPLTLGSGEVQLLDLTGAYSVFDNLGYRVPLVSILKIEKHNYVWYDFAAVEKKKDRVLDPSVAYMITSILSDNKARLLAFAENNPLVLEDRPAAAKTGTTENFHDSWTVGYTPDFVVGVWVGNNNQKPMNAVAGSIGGGQIWHDFMQSVYHDDTLVKALKNDNQLQTDFVRPPDIVEAKICSDSGLLPGDDCPVSSIRTEIFAKGHVPTEKSKLQQKIRVAKGLNCLADSDYPDEAIELRTIYNYPPELQDWAKKTGKPTTPPPPCPPYVPPTPTPTPPPSATATPIASASAVASPNPNGNGNDQPPTPVVVNSLPPISAPTATPIGGDAPPPIAPTPTPVIVKLPPTNSPPPPAITFPTANPVSRPTPGQPTPPH